MTKNSCMLFGVENVRTANARTKLVSDRIRGDELYGPGSLQLDVMPTSPENAIREPIAPSCVLLLLQLINS